MDRKIKILLIEDEISICDILCFALRKECYEVKFAMNGRDGLEMIRKFEPELVILDIMLPDIVGFDLCKTIKSQYQLPIIMLTARNDIVDKVLGLELGADDYITKPFDIREVIARIKNVFRHVDIQGSIKKEDAYIAKINKHITINKNSMTVYKDGVPVKLKPKEYDLLIMFVENKERVFTREQILDIVWSIDFEGDLRTVDVHVRRLRQKLDVNNSPSIIDTLFGKGYKMRCFE